METTDSSTSDSCIFRAGDFIGDFALLGVEDWGASTLISVHHVNIEVWTGPENFVVCLVLEAADFQDIINMHSLQMSSAIESFKSQRLEHEREANGSDPHSVGIEIGQREGKGFAHSSHLILCWGHLVRKLVKRKRMDEDVTASFSSRVERVLKVDDAKHMMQQVR